jgi:hypothetical protein
LTSPNLPNSSGIYGSYGTKIAFAGNNQYLFVSDSQYFLSSQNILVGCICVYTLNSGRYTLQTILTPGYSNLASLPDQTYSNYSVFGNYFDVSADATTLVTSDPVGGFFYIFTNTNGVWSSQRVGATSPANYNNNASITNSIFAADCIRLDATKSSIAYSQIQTTGIASVLIFNLINGLWTQTAQISDPNNAASSVLSFGSGLAFSADSSKLFIGDYSATTGTNTGVVYLYDLSVNPPAILNTYTQNPSTNAANNFGNKLLYNAAASTLFVPDYSTMVGSTYSEGAVFVFK